MQTTRTKVMFLLAVMFAGLAVWLANAWVENQSSAKAANASAEVTPIVVAAVDVRYGQQLQANHLRTVPWPTHLLPPGAVADIAEINGMVANQDIAAGDVVTTKRVAKYVGGSRLAALIPPEKRAMTVRVDDIVGVAGFLLPGNRVDIYAAKELGHGKDVSVRLLLEDISVLAVDQDASQDQGKPKVVRAVTLELTPKQAADLVGALHEGKIQLALRNPADRQLVRNIEATPENKVRPKQKPQPKPNAKPASPPPAVGAALAPAPAEMAPPPDPEPPLVTVIRGTSVSKVQPEI